MEKFLTILPVLIIIIAVLIAWCLGMALDILPHWMPKGFVKDERPREPEPEWEKEMRKNKRERDLARKHAQDLKKVMDYIDQ